MAKSDTDSVKRLDLGPVGRPGRPMSFDNCSRKFTDCASYLVDKLSKNRIERIIGSIRQPEQMGKAVIFRTASGSMEKG
jgi:hypothetical protein